MIIQFQVEQIFSPVSGKTNSLLQFKKALREEAYETCAYWIDQALKSGATKGEIASVIRNPFQHLEEPSASFS